MTCLVIFSPEAQRDADEIVSYIRQDSPDAAERFTIALNETTAGLADMPRMGRRFESMQHPTLDLRRWRVKGFGRWSIFYRYHSDREMIEIVRIIHGARDLEHALGDDAPPDESIDT